MKTLSITILLLLTLTFIFGQRSNTIFNPSTNSFQEFSRQDYIANNFTIISAYSYSINKKGKPKKDSSLLYKHQFDSSQNKLWGLNSSRVYQSHGLSFLAWDEFETYYNNNGQIIKEISRPKDIEKKVDFGSTKYTVVTNETDYEYDTLRREIKETYKTINDYYSISKYTKDTFHLRTIERPKIEEYFYNSDNQKTQIYRTVDSTRYFRIKSYNPDKDSNAITCSYCHSRYLDFERKYDSDKKLIESISYTTENLIHTKTNYFYDNQGKLIKQIDSTGWYFKTIKPYWKSVTTFQYSDSDKIVTQINNVKERFVISPSKIVSYFNANNKLIKECTFSDSTEKCTQFSFTYENNKLVKEEKKFNNGTINFTIFYYNDKGHLKEERIFKNDKLKTLFRYYYE